MGKGQALDTLRTVAGQVNACFEAAKKAEASATDKRITAGQLLLAARNRVEAGEAGDGITFRKWCEEHIKRSMRDVNRCILLIAGPKVPLEARAAEKEKNRVATAKKRSKVETDKADVSPSRAEPIDPFGEKGSVKLGAVKTPEGPTTSLRMPNDPSPRHTLPGYLRSLAEAIEKGDAEGVTQLCDHPLAVKAVSYIQDHAPTRPD